MAAGRSQPPDGSPGSGIPTVPSGRGPRVDWLLHPAAGPAVPADPAGPADREPLLQTPGRIALSACPGRPDLGGDVRSDLERLQALGIKAVVTLVADREMEYYGVFNLRQAARATGLRSLFFPCVDTQPPEDLPATYALCTEILRLLGEGQDVLIHCIGGWGRSGTLAACVLTHEGFEPQRAIELVRTARSPRCVESRAQERFVHSYSATRTGVRRYYTVVPRARVRELLSGEPGARRLRHALVPQGELVGASDLPSLVAQKASTPAALDELVVLSGELAPEEQALGVVRELPLDRAFRCDKGRWRPATFAELLA